MLTIDVTIIGGGIVGCATAAAVASPGRSVVLLERHDRLAAGTTSRNSEVAHGGMYYPPGSRKARWCVEGRRLLKQFCADAGVGWRDVGKLIVAADADGEAELQRLLERGRENGVEGLRLVGRDELRRLEPAVAGAAALFSPATAVFDAEGAARALARRAVDAGAQVLTAAAVTALAPAPGGWDVTVARGGETWTHRSRRVVNAAGLEADTVAAMAGLDPDALGLRQHWVRGSYFAVDPRHAGRLRHLVYPVPDPRVDTLGVHVCLDLAGQVRLGPDYEPLPRRVEDYRVDPARGALFFAEASPLLPFLEPDDLSPAFAGIRPKLGVTGFHDFVVRREEGEFAGLVNLVGIDSPGLTSSMAIARAVARLLDGEEA